MKVLLKTDVKGVGRRNEIKEVSDGYALNNLIPRKLAEPATDKVVKANAANMAKQAAHDKVLDELAKETTRSINGETYTMSAKASDTGHLFAKIAAKDISEFLSNSHQLAIPESSIKLEKPLKELGIHPIDVVMGNHKAKISLEIKGI